MSDNGEAEEYVDTFENSPPTSPCPLSSPLRGSALNDIDGTADGTDSSDVCGRTNSPPSSPIRGPRRRKRPPPNVVCEESSDEEAVSLTKIVLRCLADPIPEWNSSRIFLPQDSRLQLHSQTKRRSRGAYSSEPAARDPVVSSEVFVAVEDGSAGGTQTCLQTILICLKMSKCIWKIVITMLLNI